jgi:hypothetical protein
LPSGGAWGFKRRSIRLIAVVSGELLEKVIGLGNELVLECMEPGGNAGFGWACIWGGGAGSGGVAEAGELVCAKQRRAGAIRRPATRISFFINRLQFPVPYPNFFLYLILQSK